MNKLNTFIAALGLSGALLLSAQLIVPTENVVNQAHIPMPGDVPTICVGETQGITLGMYLDDAACAAIFKKRLPEYHAKVKRLVKAPMTPATEAAFASFVYNVGEGNFSRSTMLRLYNGGQKVEACEQFRKWVYGPAPFGGVADLRDGRKDGKKDCRIKENKCSGLTKRRELERELCLR